MGRVTLPTADVVVVSFNCLEMLRGILAQLAGVEGADATVTLVDNGSHDGCREMGQAWAAEGERRRAILNDRNLGFAAAANIGARTGQGEVIVSVNPDVLLPDGWLAGVLSPFTSPQVGLSGPRLVQAGGNDYPPIDQMWGNGACLAIRRTVWEELGGWDERFFCGWDDMDLVRRVYIAGWQIAAVPWVRVTHLGQQCPRDEEWRGRYDPASKAWYEEKWARTALRYLGDKSSYIIGVPARDLTMTDLVNIRRETGMGRRDLAASRLYEPIGGD